MALLVGCQASPKPAPPVVEIKLAPASAPSATEPTPAVEPPTLGPVAVIELFTSQGCSSCPPADRNLSRLARQADAGDHRLFPLSFHVDYWNDLGWRDPFSDAAFSSRQRAYSHARGSRRVYTPEMIVNGRVEFVGSNRAQADEAVNAALEVTSRVGIELEATRIEDAAVRLDYVASEPGRGLWLNLALVQRHATRDVTRGENTGQTLSHRNVVRRFERRRLESLRGSWIASLPGDLTIADAWAVAYAQDLEWTVIGAAGVGVSEPRDPP